MRHDHGAQHAHQDGDGAGRDLRFHQADQRGLPMDVDQREFINEGEADQRDEADDPLFHFGVSVGDKHRTHGDHREQRAGHERYAEEHFQGDRRAEDLGQCCCDRGSDSGEQDDPGCPGFQMPGGGFRDAVAGHNAEVGGVVLKQNQHDRGERDHPEQRIPELRSGGDVGGPVAGIDEPHCDQQARPDVLQEFLGTYTLRMLLKQVSFQFAEHVAQLYQNRTRHGQLELRVPTVVRNSLLFSVDRKERDGAT